MLCGGAQGWDALTGPLQQYTIRMQRLREEQMRAFTELDSPPLAAACAAANALETVQGMFRTCKAGHLSSCLVLQFTRAASLP